MPKKKHEKSSVRLENSFRILLYFVCLGWVWKGPGDEEDTGEVMSKECEYMRGGKQKRQPQLTMIKSTPREGEGEDEPVVR